MAIRGNIAGAAALLGHKRLKRNQRGYQADQDCISEATEVAHEQVHAYGICGAN